jgi:DNA polymerase III epsilon subunit-like protein
VGNSNPDFANKALRDISRRGDFEIEFVPTLATKADKSPKTDEAEKEKSYANAYDEYIKTWEPGDVLPIVPPGIKWHLCRFNPSRLAQESEVFEVEGQPSGLKQKSLEDQIEIDYKVLGRKLRDSVESLLRRAAGARGLWVDDKNKLRCPPGTPAANQFTDITGANCFIPTPRTAAQSGARAVRRAAQGAMARGAQVGERVPETFDFARATQAQIQELGFERAQEVMAVGGRISPPDGTIPTVISGAMNVPNALRIGAPRPQQQRQGRGSGFRGAPPGKGGAQGVWLPGLREQIYRGKRLTELADSLDQRIRNPKLPNGLFLPTGMPVGDIRNKQEFVNALSAIFPNVDPAEWGQLFDNSIPQNLSYVEKKRLKEALVSFWQGIIAEGIANPQHAQWVTQMNIETTGEDAFRVDLTPYAPDIVYGGRRASATALKLQSGQKAYETGGVHFSLNINPLKMYQQALGIGFDKNGRANGVVDSIQGDMHYMATHEFGHIAHFSSAMRALGFDPNNLNRYQLQRSLVAGQGGPQWQPKEGVGAWVIDFTKAKNPLNSPSIDLLIDAAQNLRTRTYTGYRTYSRQELERDLNNFHMALHEAVLNNITDTAEERELMNQFAGGAYGASSPIEVRAEYYAARRLFSGEKGQQDNVDLFADALSKAQNSPYNAQQIRQILDDSGKRTFGVSGRNWNISGRMQSAQNQQPSLKTRAVRRAVAQQGGGRRSSGSISGSMRAPGVDRSVASSRDWKADDTLNNRFNIEGELFSARDIEASLPSMIRTTRTTQPRQLRSISGSMKMMADPDARPYGKIRDGGNIRDIEVEGKQYSFNGEKIIFDNPEISYEDQSVKVIARNPFAITGMDETSTKGRQLAEKWTAAHIGNGLDSGRESTEIDALLYAGTRGDTEAMEEFERLAGIGQQAIDDKKRQQKTEVNLSQSQLSEIRREGLDDLSVDDLYIIHETGYTPQPDANGDIEIKPLSDFDTTTKTGSKIRYPRHTVHFGVNHMAGGHVFRQRSDRDTDIVIIPLSEMMKANPDSLDTLHSVDTYFTPKPGEGLKMKAGTYRIIKGTPDEDDTRKRVEETLKDMGAKKIFPGSTAEGSTSGVDLALWKLSAELGVSHGLHSNNPAGQIENYVTRMRAQGRKADPNIGADSAARMSRNARMRMGVTNYWQSSDLSYGRGDSISGFMRAPNSTPRYPRTPSYGPMLGRTNEIFDGVKDWNDFKSRYNDTDIVFIDYETTGLVFDEFGRASSNGAPVQIGAVRVRNGQVVDRMNTFINPGKPMSEWEQWSRDNLRGPDGNPLTDDFLGDKPSISDAHRMLAEFAGPDAIMGVQNAAFDKNVLDDALRESGIDWTPSGWIDLKDMASMTLPRYSDENPDGPFKFDKKKGKNVPSNGLADITKYLGVDLGDKHHTADADAEATAESMRKLIDGAIEKNWSSDVLTRSRRDSYVSRQQDQFNKDIATFESDLAEYKQTAVSGKMTTTPRNSNILDSVKQKAKGSTFGSNTTREYIDSLPSKMRWMAQTLEESEPGRIAARREIVAGLKQFATNGETENPELQLGRITNGLDPEFFRYLQTADENELLADLRQAGIEFHSGINIEPVSMVRADNIMDVINNGVKPNPKAAGIGKIYEADIGIHPDTENSLRPVVAQAVHTDTLAAETAEIEKFFRENNLDFDGSRYNIDLVDRTPYRRNRDTSLASGEVELILRPDVAQRTAYGNGSAINNHIFPVSMTSSDPDAIGRAVIDPNGRADDRDENIVELLYGKFKGNYNAYRTDNGKTRPQMAGRWSGRDALILGGIEPGDIQEIRIPFNSIVPAETHREASALRPGDIPFGDISSDATIRDAATKKNIPIFQIVSDIANGVDPYEAMPESIWSRINDVGSYSELASVQSKLAKVIAAREIRDRANAFDIKTSFTNQYGLDVFNGKTFSSLARANSEAENVLRARRRDIIEELIKDLRRVKNEMGKATK